MRTTNVSVELGPRRYNVVTGYGAVEKLPRLFRAPDAAARAFVMADRALPAQTAALERALEAAAWNVTTYRFAVRESLKDLERLVPVYGRLIRAKIDRHAVIVALGGGVIGDASGFLAATLLRGVRWVGVPTTLLGQVDSAIGGKTAVNHALGKNLIGAFHQPSLVVNDLAFLRTLPRRDRISGLGEIVKYALIADPRFFHALERDWRRVAALDEAVLGPAVVRCVRQKAALVAVDEFDRKGPRETLNFGHTFAHALEVTAGYNAFRHGEAVIVGMRVATALSAIRGHLAPRAAGAIDQFLRKLPVPAIPRALRTATLVAAAHRDKKKSADGRIRFVLLSGIGQTVSDHRVTDAELAAAVEAVR